MCVGPAADVTPQRYAIPARWRPRRPPLRVRSSLRTATAIPARWVTRKPSNGMSPSASAAACATCRRPPYGRSPYGHLMVTLWSPAVLRLNKNERALPNVVYEEGGTGPNKRVVGWRAQ
eukprot:1641159-Pyramimonas_sp.AAC.1